MTPAFWDTSSLVPLCVTQQPTGLVRKLLNEFSVVAWWGTPVEIRSAVERLVREKRLSRLEQADAIAKLGSLRRTWREMEPSATTRSEAERILGLHPLKGADALQLAAALTWAIRSPRTHTFISGDAQLLQAAHHSGFETIRT